MTMGDTRAITNPFGMAKILVVDDTPDIVEQVSKVLRLENFVVEEASTGADCLQLLTCFDYDLVVLDWQLPDKSGIEILREYRQLGGTARIIMLTGRTHLSDKESGLDSGADDYLTKPFEPRELCARIRALLRRHSAVQNNILIAGDLRLDPTRFMVSKGSEDIELNPREFRLLEFFVRNPNRVFSEDAILARVWSSEEEATSNALRSSLKRLRQKIDLNGEMIKNIRGVGYMFRLK